MLASIAFFILWLTAIERFIPILGLGRCLPTNVKIGRGRVKREFLFD